jgi:hypothetical protein
MMAAGLFSIPTNIYLTAPSLSNRNAETMSDLTDD